MNNYYHPCCIELILFINKSRHNFATVCVARQRDKLGDGERVMLHVYILVTAECLSPRLAASGKDMVPNEQLACRVSLREVREMFPELPNPLLLSSVVVQLLLQGFKRSTESTAVRKPPVLFNNEARSNGKVVL